MPPGIGSARRVGPLLLLCAIISSCSFALDFADGALCDGPGVCPEGLRCVEGRCRDVGARCGDFVVDAGEVCDDGNRVAGDGCAADCSSDETCGNGVVDSAAGESCDDGAQNGDYERCTTTCSRLRRCGDGIRDVPEEACDDGLENGNYGKCRVDCSAMGPFCGDGAVNAPFEVCEVGQGDPCNACALNCSGFVVGGVCGDAQVCATTETCDDGFRDACGTCNATCTAPGSGSVCGDGLLCPEFETCDDGFTDACGSCNANCTAAGAGPGACGDGAWCPEFEACDDGFNDPCGSCNTDCTSVGTGPGVCGDGDTCPQFEVCDDGGVTNCGSCDALCSGPGTGSTCGDSVLCPDAEACDDGYTDPCGTCNADCSAAGTGAVCNDGQWCPEFELCDNGNADPCDGCLPNCTPHLNSCGDGYICGAEVCDDQNQLDGDSCSADCLELTPFWVDDGSLVNLHNPKVVVAPSGQFLVLWIADSDKKIFVQRYSATAQPIGSPILVNDPSRATNSNFHADIAIFADAGFVVGWQEDLPADMPDTFYNIYFRRFDANGNETFGQTQVNTATADNQRMDAIAALPGGGFVVTWIDVNQDEPGGNDGILLKVYDNQNVAVSGGVRVNTSTLDDQKNSSIAARPDGSLIVAWDSRHLKDSPIGRNEDVYFRIFSSVGTPTGVEFLANVETQGAQAEPDVAVGLSGEFVVIWSGSDVWLRAFDAAGTPLSGEVNADLMTGNAGSAVVKYVNDLATFAYKRTIGNSSSVRVGTVPANYIVSQAPSLITQASTPGAPVAIDTYLDGGYVVAYEDDFGTVERIRAMLVPDITRQPNPPCRSVVFPSVNSAIVGNTPMTGWPGGPLTIEAWIQPSAYGPGFTGVIYTTDVVGSAALWIQPDGACCGSEVVFSPAHSWGVNGVEANAGVSAGWWAHVAGVYDGAEVRVYINGWLYNSSTAPGEALDSQLNGRPKIGQDSDGGEPFQGRIAQVRVSRIARYTGTNLSPPMFLTADADTVQLWSLDEGNGTTTVDPVTGTTATLSSTNWVVDCP